MIIKKRLKFATFGFLVLLLALFPVGSVFAAGLGHGFYGTVKVDGVNADVGTVISAQVAGTEYGDCEVTTAGQYALIVQDGIADGANIDFYVGGQEADQTFPFHDGWTTNLNLTVGAALLTAEAGGPYYGVVGEEITLSGSAIGGTSPYTYDWDLDNDGQYDDATGANPSHSWDTADTYPIGLQVTDADSATATDTTTVKVTVTAFDPWDYDTDGNDILTKDETLAAVDDYLAGNITKDEALEVVKLYFLSP